jgi:hypothetical protein
MNSWKWVPVYLLLCFLPFCTIAQCAAPLSVVAVDSIVTGTGNSSYTFSFPKFDPALGSLVEVRLQAEVTLRYHFHLENKENIAINNYRVRVVRDDELSGSALLTPLASTHQGNYGPYALAAYDGIDGAGPDYTAEGPMYVLDHQQINHAVYNTADFLGSGNVTVDYAASTYSIVFGSVNYNFNGTAEDTVRMIVTYIYCPSSSLAADITSFTAIKMNDDNIRLRWTAPNEKAGRKYTIEKSSDGRNFRDVSSLQASTGSYQQTYAPASNESGKIVFRLRQTEIDGTVKHSPIRVVDIGKKATGILLYPNPSNGAFNVMFSNTTRGDWSVSILSQDGRTLRQYEFNRALTGRINLQGQLAAGAYFIKAVNKKTMEQSIQQLILR